MPKIISDRCLVRLEPEGSCNGKWMYNHQQFTIVQKLKKEFAWWLQIELTDEPGVQYWIFEHCIMVE